MAELKKLHIFEMNSPNFELFRNKRFMLKDTFHRNASKFALFYV